MPIDIAAISRGAFLYTKIMHWNVDGHEVAWMRYERQEKGFLADDEHGLFCECNFANVRGDGKECPKRRTIRMRIQEI